MLPNAKISVSSEAQPDGTNWRASVEVKRKDGWLLKVELAEQAGGIIVSGLHLTPQSRRAVPRGGITRERHLREIRLTPFLDAASKVAARHFGDDDRAAEELGALLLGRPARFGGQKGYSESDLAQAAVQYEGLLRNGKGRKDLADARRVTPASAGNLLTRLRNEGWLESNPSPPPAERATDRAKKALARASPDAQAR